MRSKTNKFLLCFLFVVALFVFLPQQVLAAGSITNLKYFRYASSIRTPANNTFVMHYGSNSSVEIIKGNYSKKSLSVSKDTPESIALIKNVGFYLGKSVNVKITMDNKNGQAGGKMGIGSVSGFLDITISGEVLITYEFFDSEGNELPVETSFNYYGVNRNKYIGYNHPDNVIKYLVANNPTDIIYDSWSDVTSYWMYFKNNFSKPWGSPAQAFEIITKPVSRIETVVKNLDITPSSLMYETDFLANPEFSGASAIERQFDQEPMNVSVNATQTIPNVGHGSKMKSMKVNFTLDNTNKNPQYKVNDFKVTKFDGEDISNLFTGAKNSDSNYQISLKTPSNAKLYDTVLNYQVNLEWIGSDQNSVDKATIQDDYLPIPFTVNTQINGANKASSSASSYVNYIGHVTLDYLDENNSPIYATEAFKGTITEPFDLSDQYPAIEGYYPIKEKAGNDQGIFKPDPQNFVHHYKKGLPIKFTLKEAEGSLKFSRFSKTRELTIHFSHEIKEDLHFMAKFGDEEFKIKDYPDAGSDVEDKVIFKVPDTWIDHEVAFYMENDTGQKSTKENDVLRLIKVLS